MKVRQFAMLALRFDLLVLHVKCVPNSMGSSSGHAKRSHGIAQASRRIQT